MKFKFICSIVLCIIISILLSSCASIPINNNISLTKEEDYLIDAGNRNVVNSPIKENQTEPTDNQKENVENEVGQTEPTDSDDIGPSDPNDPQATECPSFEDVPSDNDENGDSLKPQIKLAYAEYLNAKDNTYLQARDIEIGRYFGNYLGCEIVLIGAVTEKQGEWDRNGSDEIFFHTRIQKEFMFIKTKKFTASEKLMTSNL